MRSCATWWSSLLSSWSSLWLLFGWNGRRGQKWNVIVNVFDFIVLTLISGHLWEHCWSIILHRWHWILGGWGGGGVYGRGCKGIWWTKKKLLLRWKCWVVKRWLMEDDCMTCEVDPYIWTIESGEQLADKKIVVETIQPEKKTRYDVNSEVV